MTVKDGVIYARKPNAPTEAIVPTEETFTHNLRFQRKGKSASPDAAAPSAAPSSIKAADLTDDADFDTLESKGYSKSYARDFQKHEGLNFSGLTRDENAALRKPGQGNLVEALIRESLYARRSGDDSGIRRSGLSNSKRIHWADETRGRKSYSVGSGQESDVFSFDGSPEVFKLRKVNDAKGVVGSLLDLVYHNTLFPDDAYTFHGFTDDGRMLVSQPAVNIKRDADGNYVVPTVEQVMEALPPGFSVDENNDGVKSDSTVPGGLQVYSDQYVLSDLLRGENVVIDADTGKVRFIDPRIVPNSKDGVITGVEQHGRHSLVDSIGDFSSYRDFVDISANDPDSLQRYLDDLSEKYSYGQGDLFVSESGPGRAESPDILAPQAPSRGKRSRVSRTVEQFADRKGVADPKRRTELKKEVSAYQKFAKEYRELYADALDFGKWKAVLDFAHKHGMPLAGNVLTEYFTEPKFNVKKLAGLVIARPEDAAIVMGHRTPFSFVKRFCHNYNVTSCASPTHTMARTPSLRKA